MSTHDDDDDRDYEVGYRRPPKATQYKNGHSGNPKGRPKASKAVGTLLEEAFYRKISITENGKKRTVTMMEAILRQLANGAAKGEIRHMDRALKLLPILQEARAAAISDEVKAERDDPASERAVLEVLAEMVGGDPEQLFATFQKGADDDNSDAH